jgi:CubicO group peptidase (beta-lactamase class C family)
LKNYVNVKKWVEYIIPKYMREHKIPGISIGIVKDGKPLYVSGFGARDPQKNLPATPDTLFGIGSITKSFVAIAIMQLSELGKLSVDDPVNKYIPFELGLPGRPITIQHFLTHSSGIPSLATSTVALSRGLGVDTGIPWGSVEDFYRLVNDAQDEIAAEPGNRFFYHNAAWRMLGHIIQKLSGMPFHIYIKKNILEPLGMIRSTLNSSEFNTDSNHIVPHWNKPSGKVEPSKFPYPNPDDNPEFSFIAAAGGIASSVNEMLLYLNSHINMGTYDGGQICGIDSFESMQTGYIKRGNILHGEHWYGYGLNIIPDYHGYKLIGHGGSILVSTAHMSYIPEIKTGVIMMANSAQPPWEDIAEGVYLSILDLDPLDDIQSLRIKRSLSLLAGEYEIFKGIEKVEVQYKGGMIYLRSRTPFTDSLVPLIPVDPYLDSTIFYTYVDGVITPIEFDVHENGDIDLYIERYRYHKTK